MAETTLPTQCIVAEKEFAVMAHQVKTMIDAVERLNAAILGNGKPGIVSEISAIKAHIGFNQNRTLHERMTAVEDFVLELQKEHAEQRADAKRIVLPILERIITFALGGLAYVLAVNALK